MSISDRLDQIGQRYGDVSIADASRHTLIGRDIPDMVAALRAVLDVCDRVEASIIPRGDFETGQKSASLTVRSAVTAALGEA